jgi:hypothetical protein
MKTIDRMTAAELCVESTRLRGSLVTSIEQLRGLYELLQRKAKLELREVATTTRSKTAHDPMETARVHLAIASAGQRFTGMVLHATRRLGAFDRTLKRDKVAQDLHPQDRPAPQKAKAAPKSAGKDPILQQVLSLPTVVDDLDELYGDAT